MTIILFGGRSDERHVSVASAQNIVRTLESRGLPFTGSGSAASAAAFDKARAKDAVSDRVRTPQSRTAGNAAELRGAVNELFSCHARVVLKPLAGGSSRGLFFLDIDGDRDAVIREAAGLRVPYIVEQFLPGREITVGVVDRGDGPFALPCLEIEVDPGHAFDYEGKYLGKGTREICPANLPPWIATECQRAALEAHLAL